MIQLTKMADDLGNEDQWLYGDSNPEQPEESNTEKSSDINNDEPPSEETETHEEKETSEELPPPEVNENLPAEETNGSKENGDNFDKMESDEEEDEDDDSDDDVNVVIGDIKTSTTYTSLNIKRGGLMSSGGVGDKSKPQPGKFSIEEFESIGTINGVPAQEFNLDSLEDKPWRKPGADITDYFNYGFNEDTWRAYCERQKRMRVHESGAGLLPMNPSGLIRSTSSITNENSKYSGSYLGPRKAGPPPGRRMMGSIDVIGGNSGLASRRVIDTVKATPPKENVIQVMTADRREYSRKVPTFPDLSVPPPGGSGVFDAPPVGSGGNSNNSGPGFGSEYPNEFYSSDVDPYYQSYEPTQEQQWGNDPIWAPSKIKELTPGPSAISTITPISLLPSLGPPGMPGDGPPTVPGVHGSGSQHSLSVQPPISSPIMDSHSQDGYRNHEPREDSSGRDREREHQSRDRSEKPDRHRDRTHKRDRSRSRSRRHKSRSRSPSHRSHKKKKSKRHESESE